MKILLLIITMITVSGLNAMYLSKGPLESFDVMEESTCVDCFDRRVAEGATYWSGCNFCKCDRSVTMDERCKPSGCYWSPCPKIRAEIQSHVKSKVRDWSWPKSGFGRR